MLLISDEAVLRTPELATRSSSESRVQARLEVLAAAGLLLASAGDHVTILEKLTKLAVPALGERCAVHVVGEGGLLEPLAIRDGEVGGLPRLEPDSCGVTRVAATGQPEAGLLSRDDYFLAVPLVVRDRVLGVLSLVRSRCEYDAGERAFVEELARRVAMCLENALLLREISAREAALREQAVRLETLNRIGQRLAAIHDLDDILREVCDAATEMTGAELGVYLAFDDRGPRHAVRGATVGELSLIERRQRELSADVVARAVPAPIRIADVTCTTAPPPLGMIGDLPRVVSYLAVPVHGRRSSTVGVIVLACSQPGAFDLHDEELIVGLASVTATAIDSARLFGEARELIAALEKKNRELDQFAYVASHDLRAPLRGIGNLAAWIEEDLDGQLPARSRQYLHLLRDRVRRLDDLIQGVLEYSRVGRVSDQPIDLDLGVLAREVIELLAPPECFELVVARDLPVLRSARVPLQQVLMNLIGNAIKHAVSSTPRIEIGAAPCEGGWEIYVRDNGPGIAPRHHEQIWGLFQTLSSRDRVDTTGLGLAIVRKIVEAHGGHAWVESREGEGATFRFTWPGTPPVARAWH